MLKEVIYNEKELYERLIYWQEKLRLRDWIVDIEFRRERDMETTESNAEIYYSLPNKTAYINIVDPIDFNDRKPQDMDWLIVHELLHIHFAPWYSDKDEIAIEQRIESISYGLVKLERK